MVLALRVCLAESRLSTCSTKELSKRGPLCVHKFWPRQRNAPTRDNKAVELRKILPQRNRGEARIGLLKIETLSCNAGWRYCH